MLIIKSIKKNLIYNIREYLLLSFSLLIILSINSSFLDAQKIFDTKFDMSINYFITLFNSARFFFPFLVFLMLFVYVKNFNYIKLFKNSFFLFFILYFLYQLLVYNKFHMQHDWSYIQLAMAGCIFSLICSLSIVENLKYFSKYLFIITIITFSLFTLYLSSKILILAIENGDKYLYWSNALEPSKQTFGQANPRVTGLSRTLLIFFVFLFFLTQKFNKIIKILTYIVLFLSIFILYGMQTRGALIGLIIFLVIYLFFVNEFYLKKVLKIFFLIILPVIVYENSMNIKIKHDNSIDRQGRYLRDNKIVKDSSGRIDLWKLSFNLIKEHKIILGLGPQGDRQIFDIYQQNTIQTIESIKWSTNVSNGYIYSYLSAGIVGFCIALIVTMILVKEVFVAVIKNKIFKKNRSLNYLSVFCILFLISRTVFENGLFFFGIDYIFILISYLNLYIFNDNLKNNITK